ncbi:hypothetical protein EVAR_62476_1 [Eumeta japonica]|uniref:Uncharacterized protein n=1 Tax=Eumeta variegata TaxID=151549 RepID=A0A4C1ZM50_EUMVA|nr:hypothetical protein EVAR_62476_1 [Eumeta japonica]
MIIRREPENGDRIQKGQRARLPAPSQGEHRYKSGQLTCENNSIRVLYTNTKDARFTADLLRLNKSNCFIRGVEPGRGATSSKETQSKLVRVRGPGAVGRALVRRRRPRPPYVKVFQELMLYSVTSYRSEKTGLPHATRTSATLPASTESGTGGARGAGPAEHLETHPLKIYRRGRARARRPPPAAANKSLELPPHYLSVCAEYKVARRGSVWIFCFTAAIHLIIIDSTSGLRIRRPVSALNGRATAPVDARCTAIPACGSRRVLRARRVRARRRVLRPTAPRPRPRAPFYFVLPHDLARVPRGRHHLRCCGSVRHRPNTLAATAMDKAKLQAFLTEPPRPPAEFEAYCSSPASPDPQVVVFDPEMDLEYTLPREPKKRSANARPSEGTSSDSESDPGSSDSPDHSGFTTVRRRRAAKGKPKAAGLTQTSDGSMCYRLTPAPRKPKKANVGEATPSGKSTSSIYASPVSWRTPSQPAAASQEAVGDGGVKAAAPAAAKNSRGDEADVTAPPNPAPRGPKPPPMFVQDKDRWTELRRRCADKGIHLASAQFRSGIEAAGENLGAPNTEPIPKTLDLVLVSGTAEANDKATKAAFFKIRSVCPLRRQSGAAPQTRLTRAVSQLPVLRAFVPFCFHSARCVKRLGDHGTAQCTHKDTDGPPACVPVNRRAIRPTTLDARVLQRDPPPEKAVPRRLRAQSRRHSVMLERRLDRVTPRPPQRTLLHPLTI